MRGPKRSNNIFCALDSCLKQAFINSASDKSVVCLRVDTARDRFVASLVICEKGRAKNVDFMDKSVEFSSEEHTPATLAQYRAKVDALEQLVQQQQEQLALWQAQVKQVVISEVAAPLAWAPPPVHVVLPEVSQVPSVGAEAAVDRQSLAQARIAAQEWQYRYEILWQDYQSLKARFEQVVGSKVGAAQ
jgi:hypothetical protein